MTDEDYRWGWCRLGLHRWNRWKSYTWEGQRIQHGPVSGVSERQTYDVVEYRQKRTCACCGLEQDREVW
jgi:hypothetical protein